MINLKQQENCANSLNTFFRGCKIDGVRIGKWDYIVNGESMFGGEYNNSGQKVGKWIEPDQNNEQKKSFITFSGEYRKDIKVGIWNTLLIEQLIGGGEYNEKGQKQGMWIEILNKTTTDFPLLYQGNYKEGRRVNYWKWSLYEEVIGQGQYNTNGYKEKFWTEVDENYSKLCKLKFQGSYKNGLRIGNWMIFDDDQIIGGGEYSNEFKKNRIWKEPIENYTLFEPVIQEGTYKKGIRVGQWNILLNNAIIGGGKYDNNGQKQDDWIDVEMIDIRKMISVGQYNNGVRIFKWNFQLENQIFQCMYNENGEKQDYWVDIKENYYENEILFEGNYRQGIRFGLWKIQQQNNIIGNGLYDGFGQKVGLWKELHPKYSETCELMMKGEYRNRVKIGYWQIVTQQQNKFIGGGSYNDHGQKIGKWIELHKCYSKYRQVVCKGSYVDGVKIGGWEDIYLNQIRDYHYYDKEGRSTKVEKQK